MATGPLKSMLISSIGLIALIKTPCSLQTKNGLTLAPELPLDDTTFRVYLVKRLMTCKKWQLLMKNLLE